MLTTLLAAVTVHLTLIGILVILAIVLALILIVYFVRRI